MGFFLETLLGGLMAGMLYSLVALGFVLILKASGVFNFAQGAMMLLAALEKTGTKAESLKRSLVGGSALPSSMIPKFRDLYGVNMPRHKLYSPISVQPVQASGGQTADPVSGSMTGPSLTPGSLRTRSDWRTSLA